MNTSLKQLEIHQIIFESEDPEILVSGRVFDGLLSYTTEISINHTQLNRLLCLLGQIEGMPGSDSLFEREITAGGQHLYTAIFSKSEVTPMVTMDFFDLNTAKKVRA